jgi:hypothetical protein
MYPQTSANTWQEGGKAGRFQLLALVAACATAIPVGVVGLCQWRAVREAEVAAGLKRDLIDRGLSVFEAERLAGGGHAMPREAEQSGYYRTQHAAIEAALKKDLAARGLGAQEIETILGAWSGGVPASGRYSYETAEKARKEADFIRELVQSGRPAREVERIVRAATPATTEAQRAEVEAALKVLRHSGLTPEEILRALGQPAEAPAVALMPREP